MLSSARLRRQNLAFLLVEDDSIAVLDLAGDEVDQHQFERLRIHGITVTPDGECTCSPS